MTDAAWAETEPYANTAGWQRAPATGRLYGEALAVAERRQADALRSIRTVEMDGRFGASADIAGRTRMLMDHRSQRPAVFDDAATAAGAAAIAITVQLDPWRGTRGGPAHWGFALPMGKRLG